MASNTITYPVSARVLCPVTPSRMPRRMEVGTIAPRWGGNPRNPKRASPRNAHGFYWVEVQDQFGARLVLCHETEISPYVQ